MSDEEKNSPYSLTEKERELVEGLIKPKQVAAKTILDRVNSALEETFQSVFDRMNSYLEDEYILEFEEIARRKAGDLLIQFVKGDETVKNFLGFAPRPDLWGKPNSYDSHGIRKIIIERHKDEIQTTAMADLMEENERLKKDLEFYRNRY